jgi:hypothetical protein
MNHIESMETSGLNLECIKIPRFKVKIKLESKTNCSGKLLRASEPH